MPDTSAAPLAVSHVTKRFGGLLAVNDVSFELTRGTLTSLIGPNGAGKTTLFNAISGIGRVSEGRVEIAGVDVTGLQPHRIAALGVGRTFQNARLFGEMTVLENVVAGAFRTERTSFAADLFALPSSRRSEREATERARETLARLGLESLASTLARDLAFGDRRRVELARATASDPWLLLVDEPAAGLNASERAALTADLLKLRDAGMTLLLIEHDMRLVMSISERVMVLKFGTMIADGKADAVRNDPASLLPIWARPANMLLEVRDLHAGYGELDVLRGITLTVDAGEMVAVLGPTAPANRRCCARYRASIPTRAPVRSSSTATTSSAPRPCRGSLRLFARARRPATLQRTLGRRQHSPGRVHRRPQEYRCRGGRRVRTLPGAGRTQITNGVLALGRRAADARHRPRADGQTQDVDARRTKHRASPQIVEQIFGILADLKRGGTAVLIVEQNAYLTLQHADRAYVLENVRSR